MSRQIIATIGTFEATRHFFYLSYLFKENVFIFELCVMGLRPHGAVMRVVSVACEFSVVVRAGAAGWRGLVGLLEHYAVM